MLLLCAAAALDKRFYAMKTVLITGSTDGIGKETARQLALKGWQVIIHGRSEQRCQNVKNELRKSNENSNIEYVCSDQVHFADIHRLAQAVKERFGALNVLINNAGVFESKQQFTIDGIERTFAINHLSYFLLTGLLMDILKQNTPARIINVSSMAHASQFDFENVRGQKHYSGYEAYAQSKLANILFTFRLAEKLKDEGITVNCLHPGVINTKLLQTGWGMGGGSVEQGAQTSVYLASSPEVKNITGKYFSDSRVTNPANIADDHETQIRLWRLSESLCNYVYKF